MNRRIAAILAVAVLVFIAGCSQDLTFSLSIGGIVRDQSTGLGIPGVLVSAEIQGKPGSVTASTNASGDYSLLLSGLKRSSVITIQFTHAEYWTESRTFTRNFGGSYLLNVFMTNASTSATISGYATLMNASAPASSKTPMATKSISISGIEPEPEEVIVSPKSSAKFVTIEQFAMNKGSTIERSNPRLGIIILKVPQGMTAAEFVMELEAQPWVDYAEPNGQLSASIYSYTIPNDLYFPGYQWNLYAVSMPYVWGAGFFSPPVEVAVIDTRVDVSHPDLSGNVRPLIDVVNSPYEPSQARYPHGTHVAGITGAKTGNGQYMAGMNISGVSILPIRALRDDGNGSYDDIATAIQAAYLESADVINLSLGGLSSSTTVETQVNEALARGIAVVAAAGNNGSSPMDFPARIPGVIAVSAVGDNFEKASYSSWGEGLDFAAPGGTFSLGVKSLFPTDRGSVGSMAGTSQAAPHVAGLIAMLMQQGHSASSAVDVMRKTAQLSDLTSPYFGSGIINAHAAMKNLTLDKVLFWLAYTSNGEMVPGSYGYGNASDRSFGFPSQPGTYYLAGWLDTDASMHFSNDDYFGQTLVTIGNYGLFLGSSAFELRLWRETYGSSSTEKNAVSMPDLSKLK